MRSFAKLLWPLVVIQLSIWHKPSQLSSTCLIKRRLYSYFTMQILHNFQNSFTYSLSSKMCNKVIINKSTTCHTLLHYLSALWNINVQKLTIWNRHCDHIAWWYIWGVVGFLNCRWVYAKKISKIGEQLTEVWTRRLTVSDSSYPCSLGQCSAKNLPTWRMADSQCYSSSKLQFHLDIESRNKTRIAGCLTDQQVWFPGDILTKINYTLQFLKQ